MFTAITKNNHQLHCSGFRKNDSMCEPLCLYQHGSSKSCNIDIYWWQCSPLPRLHQQPSSPQAPMLHVPSGCGQRFSSMLCLPQVGAFPFAPFLPVLTFAQSVQLALQWAGDAQRAIPKRKLAPPLRPVSLLRRLRPLPPFPRVPLTTAWLLSLTSTSGPPALPLLHLFSRGR